MALCLLFLSILRNSHTPINFFTGSQCHYAQAVFGSCCLNSILCQHLNFLHSETYSQDAGAQYPSYWNAMQECMCRGPKIGASIKLVSQKDGRDMDPQNTKFQPRGEGGPPGQGGRRPVGAQAGATTGHLYFILFTYSGLCMAC